MSASKAIQVQTERDEHNEVFISYRRGACGNRNINDLVSAIQLQLMLKAKGLTVFVDKSGIAAGNAWRDKFATELRFARVVILVISRNTMCRYERPKTDLVSMFSGMLVSGVQALAEPLVSLAGGSSSSSTPIPRASSTDGVDNLLLEWMIAMSLQKQKIVFPVFIGDSDAATGVVGDLLELQFLQNVAEPPARVFNATRAYASAYLASQCDPPVLLAECCASLSSLIFDGVQEKNAVVVKSVAWEIVPEIVVSQVFQSPQMREVLAALASKKGAASLASDDSLRSPGSPFTPKQLLRSLNSPLEQPDDPAESLYKNCFFADTALAARGSGQSPPPPRLRRVLPVHRRASAAAGHLRTLVSPAWPSNILRVHHQGQKPQLLRICCNMERQSLHAAAASRA
jgi:hypothetical protein